MNVVSTNAYTVIQSDFSIELTVCKGILRKITLFQRFPRTVHSVSMQCVRLAWIYVRLQIKQFLDCSTSTALIVHTKKQRDSRLRRCCLIIREGVRLLLGGCEVIAQCVAGPLQQELCKGFSIQNRHMCALVQRSVNMAPPLRTRMQQYPGIFWVETGEQTAL